MKILIKQPNLKNRIPKEDTKNQKAKERVCKNLMTTVF